MAVHAEQRHVVCRLRLQESVITETKHVGEVRMEEHLVPRWRDISGWSNPSFQLTFVREY